MRGNEFPRDAGSLSNKKPEFFGDGEMIDRNDREGIVCIYVYIYIFIFIFIYIYIYLYIYIYIFIYIYI